jgi:cytochrome c peroxidase
MRFSGSTRSVSFLLAIASVSALAAVTTFIPNLKHFLDPTGAVATFNTAGKIDRNTAFFQSLGTNGRSCESCHQADQAFSLSARRVRELYERTHGEDPLFAAVDGANCPDAEPGDREAHSLLLSRGLIRIGVTLPANAQFTIAVAHDPYGCAVTYDGSSGQPTISVYRRPLPTTNLRYLSTIMFDGRETISPLNNAVTFQANLTADLTHQALSAIQTHAQASTQPTDAQLAEIVAFELGLSTAQIHSNRAGELYRDGATGGPSELSVQPYYPGANDSLGHDPSGAPFNPSAFSIFKSWANSRDKGRADIAAGEVVFNTAAAIITDVRGLNDNPALGSPASITGTCTTCHDSPNVGNHTLPLPLDIATSRRSEMETNPSIVAGLQQLSPPDMPVYEIRGCPDPQNPGNSLVLYTSDPGKGLVTGQCIDVGRGKGLILRGLAARAPYFHNGAAANLKELVDFYNLRFQMNLDDQQRHDLIAFLNSL